VIPDLGLVNVLPVSGLREDQRPIRLNDEDGAVVAGTDTPSFGHAFQFADVADADFREERCLEEAESQMGLESPQCPIENWRSTRVCAGSLPIAVETERGEQIIRMRGFQALTAAQCPFQGC
jgi:hypothetical protein